MKRRLLVILVVCCCIPTISEAQILTNPIVEKITNGYQFVEGPVWKDGVGLLFSDIPANRVYLWTEEDGASVYLEPSGNSNGLAYNQDGYLLLAQHGPRQLARLEEGGTIIPIATHYDGLRLNSPNDLAMRSDGSVFFADPPYGLMDQGGISETGFNGIYRLSSSGEVQLMDTSLNRPNGIAFSPDETKLYVTDSETRKLFVWDVVDDTTITNKQELAFMQPAGYADGMKVDPEGYLYVSGPIGIWIFSSDGTAIDIIPVPGQTSNCAWGNDDRQTLFVTSGDAVYRISNDTVTISGIKENGPEVQFLDSYPNPCCESTHICYYLEYVQQVRVDIFRTCLNF